MMTETCVGSSKKKLRRAIFKSRLICASARCEQARRAAQARARRKIDGRAFMMGGLNRKLDTPAMRGFWR